MNEYWHCYARVNVEPIYTIVLLTNWLIQARGQQQKINRNI